MRKRNSEIEISTLEKILINSCTPIIYPVIYVMTLGRIHFKEIVEDKEDAYRILVQYLERDGEIPLRVRAPYHTTLCGNIIVATAYVRSSYQKSREHNEQ